MTVKAPRILGVSFDGVRTAAREDDGSTVTTVRPDPIPNVGASGGLAADHQQGVAVMAILLHLPPTESRTLAVEVSA